MGIPDHWYRPRQGGMSSFSATNHNPHFRNFNLTTVRVHHQSEAAIEVGGAIVAGGSPPHEQSTDPGPGLLESTLEEALVSSSVLNHALALPDLDAEMHRKTIARIINYLGSVFTGTSARALQMLVPTVSMRMPDRSLPAC